MARDTSAVFAAGSLHRRAAWVDIWNLFIALMAPDMSATLAARNLLGNITWTGTWRLFIALVAQVISAMFEAGSLQPRTAWSLSSDLMFHTTYIALQLSVWSKCFIVQYVDYGTRDIVDIVVDIRSIWFYFIVEFSKKFIGGQIFY